MRHRTIDLDANLFAVAFAVFCRNWMPFAAAVVVLVAANASVGFVDAPILLAVLRALVLMSAAYASYRTLTSGGAVAGWRAAVAADRRFPWRYAAVTLIILSPVLVLGVVWNAPGRGAGPGDLGGVLFGLAMVLGYAALYVLIGTALPEVAERGAASLGVAFRRGRRNYRAIGRALVFGVWLFRAGSVLSMVVLNMLGVVTDFSAAGAGELNPAAFGPMLLFNASHVFAECLTAVVLVRAYRRYAGDG